MGLTQKILVGGGGSILAILLVVFLATKTNILSKVTSGLTSAGGALGSGIGGGIGAGFVGLGTGLTQQLQRGTDYYGTSFERFLNFLQGKDTLSGPSLNPNQYDYCLKYPNQCNAQPKDENPATGPTVNPAIDDNGYGGFGTKAAQQAALTSTIAAQNAMRRASPSYNKTVAAAINKGYSNLSAASRRTAQARFRARKSRKCFNSELDMGGLNHVIDRQIGVVPMHG